MCGARCASVILQELLQRSAISGAVCPVAVWLLHVRHAAATVLHSQRAARGAHTASCATCCCALFWPKPFDSSYHQTVNSGNLSFGTRGRERRV